MTNLTSTIRQPSAFLPVVLSLVALILVLGHVALFSIAHEADEGTVAHIWQILMATQVPIMAFFALKYVPRKPKQALLVLVFQIVAALTACAPVFFLNYSFNPTIVRFFPMGNECLAMRWENPLSVKP